MLNQFTEIQTRLIDLGYQNKHNDDLNLSHRCLFIIVCLLKR